MQASFLSEIKANGHRKELCLSPLTHENITKSRISPSGPSPRTYAGDTCPLTHSQSPKQPPLQRLLQAHNRRIHYGPVTIFPTSLDVPHPLAGPARDLHACTWSTHRYTNRASNTDLQMAREVRLGYTVTSWCPGHRQLWGQAEAVPRFPHTPSQAYFTQEAVSAMSSPAVSAPACKFTII